MDDTFHTALRRAQYMCRRYIIEKASLIGLLPGQPKILEFLSAHGICFSKDIAAWCLLDKSTTARLLDRMEKDGLILRCPYPSDRRASHISLTEKGIAMAEKVRLICEEADDIALSNMNKEEIALLKKALQTVAFHLEAHV